MLEIPALFPSSASNNVLAVFGLGNPGNEYDRTRHNVGFHVIDELAYRCGCSLYPRRDVHACVGVWKQIDRKLILAKPTTFMNKSGMAVQAVLRWYNLTPAQSIIIVDNVDLPVGTVRFKKKGTMGTHNGIRSIVNSIGTAQFMRIYIGVGSALPRQSLASYVLGKWHHSEDEEYTNAFVRSATALQQITANTLDEFPCMLQRDM